MKTKIASLLLSSTLAAGLILSTHAATAEVDLGENNWAWGKDDVRGAGNLMTANSIKAALAAVESGEIIELSHDVAVGAPYINPIQTPYVITLARTS
ncbi:hypothetical protein A9Q90_05440, partial [Gammaproteobacteria bacterium 54_18_T64]